jgi:hypothetical protein
MFSAEIVAQWEWKYDANPFNPAAGPTVYLVQIGGKLVSQIAAFWVADLARGYACRAPY